MSKKKQLFLNRELSWLSFNDRVLQEAQDESVPLLERIRFLGIFSNNLDEFYKVRVASLTRAIAFSKKEVDPMDFDPATTLRQISLIVAREQQKFDKTFDRVVSLLAKQNIIIADEKGLSHSQRQFVSEFFELRIRPVLMPIRLETKGKFPQLRDSTIYFAIELLQKTRQHAAQYALLEIPSDLPRFVVLPHEDNRNYVMFIDDIIRRHLTDIFGILRFDTANAYTIKIVRDAELDMDDDLSKSMVDKMTRSVRQRREGQYIRLNYDREMPEHLLQFILQKTRIRDKDSIISGGRYHNKKDLVNFPDLDSELMYPRRPPLDHPDLARKAGILDRIKKQDVLLFFPYHSFRYVINMLRESALDPGVSTIRICLYRAAKNSQIVTALVAAAKNGKKVVAVVEIQARFDEENNLEITRQLQEAGVRVIPGVQGLKVHSKLILITRREKGRAVRYSLAGTGNLNEISAQFYSDIALLTSHREIGNEMKRLFDFFETNYERTAFRHLLVAPFNARRKILDLINNEIAQAEKGRNAWIKLKMNNLVDASMIRKLYEAGNKGVRIDLNIRGICCLIAGKTGLSKNITARSIVGRYLEHSRVMIFANKKNPLYFISSADWMTRSLDYRVETIIPVYDDHLKSELKEFIDLQQNGIKARVLDRQFSNKYLGESGNKQPDLHEILYTYFESKKSRV